MTHAVDETPFFPPNRYTPTRGDTTVILGSYLGVHLAVWCNYHLGLMRGPAATPPYPIIWPTYEQFLQVGSVEVGQHFFIQSLANARVISGPG